MDIDGQRLKDLRLRPERRLSHDQLAERTRLSKRQIQRLESEAAGNKTVHERTALKLAEALGVELGVLTGELPIPTEDDAPRRREAERVQISAWIAPDARLAYGLIAKRYGVNATTIMNVAPLFFTLLAEGCLNWRRDLLRQLDEAAEQMHQVGRAAGHLAYAHCVARATEAAADEEESIDKADLFGEHVSEEAYELGYDRSKHNPFADYLRKLVADLDRPGVVEIDPDGDRELGFGALENFPIYSVCNDDLEAVTGGSWWARHALECGHARLSEIPEELWRDGAAEERKKWLEDKVPEDDRALFASIADTVSDALDHQGEDQ